MRFSNIVHCACNAAHSISPGHEHGNNTRVTSGWLNLFPLWVRRDLFRRHDPKRRFMCRGTILYTIIELRDPDFRFLLPRNASRYTPLTREANDASCIVRNGSGTVHQNHQTHQWCTALFSSIAAPWRTANPRCYGAFLFSENLRINFPSLRSRLRHRRGKFHGREF